MINLSGKMGLLMTLSIICLSYLNYNVTASAIQEESLEKKVADIESKQSDIDQVFQETGEILTNYLHDSPDQSEVSQGGSYLYITGGKELQLTSTPDIILSQITQTTVVNCSVNLHQLEFLDKNDDVITDITSISIKRDDKDIAGYRRNKPALSFEEDPNVKVEGQFKDKTGYLTITYTKPTTDQAGNYLGRVGGFDQRGFPFILGKTLDVLNVNYVQMVSDIEALKNENQRLQKNTSKIMADKQQNVDKKLTKLEKLVESQNDKINNLSKTNEVQRRVLQQMAEVNTRHNDEINDLTKKVKAHNVSSLSQKEEINQLFENINANNITSVEQNDVINQIQYQLDNQINRFNLSVDHLQGKLSDLDKKENTNVLFSASVKSSTKDISQYKAVIFDHVIDQIGDGYDPRTGVFTCPKSGHYIFLFQIQQANNKYGQLSLRHNGSKVIDMYFSSVTKYELGSNSVILFLSKGDTVKIVSDASLTKLYSSSAAVNTFTGILLSSG